MLYDLPVYNIFMNINISNKRKLFLTLKKDEENENLQKLLPIKKTHLSSTSCPYTCSSLNSAAELRVGGMGFWSLRELR